MYPQRFQKLLPTETRSVYLRVGQLIAEAVFDYFPVVRNGVHDRAQSHILILAVVNHFQGQGFQPEDLDVPEGVDVIEGITAVLAQRQTMTFQPVTGHAWLNVLFYARQEVLKL